ncbi:VOC family protein [candidate division KSB1 bacterium]|nr:VOC family protein [candidate division KSB1 bacterium]
MSHLNFAIYLITIYFGFGNQEIKNNPQSRFRLDHINIAVKDLEKAKQRYQDLGFSIKPGKRSPFEMVFQFHHREPPRCRRFLRFESGAAC